MKFTRKALLAAMLLAAGSANAAMQGATSGNGELLINFIYQGGPSATTGGDDISAVFDLGVSMNDVLSWNGQSGFTRTWNLITGLMSGTGIVGAQAIGNYGSAWANLLSFVPNDNAIEFNVIALDNTDKVLFAGASRYLTTADVATFPSLTNANLNGFDNMDMYVNANNNRGTHGSAVNGASTATPSDPSNTYFRAVNGFGLGDTWLNKTTADTTKPVATAQNFWFLTTTAPGGVAQVSKTLFGFDLNGNGSIGAGEFSEFSVNLATGDVTFATPVPEASSYGMMLAGLGLVGFMARRRMNRNS